jgi:ComF family protein
MNEAVRNVLLDALAVLAPVSCAGCGAPDRGLCPACRLALVARPRQRVLRGGLVVTSALSYAGPVRGAILAFKENGRTDLSRALAAPLAVAVREARGAVPEVAPVEFVTVPTTRAAYRRRGYDPVALLARRAGVHTSRVFARPRSHPDQKSLGRLARAQNLAGSFEARARLEGRGFIVLDDIVTTGATVLEAARALRAAGGRCVAAVGLASTPEIFPADARSFGPNA